MKKRIEPHIEMFSGNRGVGYYLTIRDNGTTYNKMFKSLEEAQEMKKRIQRTQIVKGFEYPDTLIDILFRDDETIDINCVEETLKNDIMWVLEDLTEREQIVIKKRYIEGLTLESVALHLGVSRERVRQIEAKAIRKLKYPPRLARIRYGKKVYEIQDDIKKLERELLEVKHRLINKINNPDLIELTEDEKLEAIKLEDLDFSTRTYNSLRRGGIDTLADLITKTELELLRIRNLGRFSLREIKNTLQERGYDLKEEENE